MPPPPPGQLSMVTTRPAQRHLSMKTGRRKWRPSVHGTVISNVVMPITAELPKRSVNTVRGRMDLFWGGQMLMHGNVTPVTAGSPVEWLHHRHNREADDRSDLLDRYLRAGRRII